MKTNTLELCSDPADLATISTLRWIASVAACMIFLMSLPSSSTAAEPRAAQVRLKDLGMDPSGRYMVELEGSRPGVYEIQVSDDLVQWHTLFKQMLVDGRMSFADSARARGQTRYFYRAVLLNEPAYMPGEVLLQYKPEATVAGQNGLQASARLTIHQKLLTSAMWRSGVEPIFQASTTLPVSEALAILQADPMIQFAEPNYLLTKTRGPEGEEEIPVNDENRFGNEGEDEPLNLDTASGPSFNDPLFLDGSLWGMQSRTSDPANEFGSQAASLWAQGRVGSQKVYIGIIDQGIQSTHPDLVHNIWSNPFEIPRNGLDDDGNGYADDIHGWDFRNDDNSVYDGTPDHPETDEHGTHVAGIIGAVGGNALGVAGVNWQVTMIPAKFLGLNSGTTSDAMKAIDYFVDLKQRHGLNIVALNCSWASRGFSLALHQAIVRAAKADILLIAAAGNGGHDAMGDDSDETPCYPANYDTQREYRIGTFSTPLRPASYDSVISVAAIDNQGDLASFSNFGNNSVDLGAPGVSIMSTLPFDNYGKRSGTSMATPHVTGAVAFYASLHPEASGAEIRQALLNGTEPTPSLSGQCATSGRLSMLFMQSTPNEPADIIYVDGSYSGSDSIGTKDRPFRSVFEGHLAARDGSLVRVRHNVYYEYLRLTKAIRLEPFDGTVRMVSHGIVVQ